MHNTTFTTAGSDGTFHFWDRISHTRCARYDMPSATALPAAAATVLHKNSTNVGTEAGLTRAAILTTAFNRDGSLFAYAVGYDWSLGHTVNSPNYPNRLVLHTVTAQDALPTAKK